MRELISYIQFPRMMFADVLYLKSKKVVIGQKSLKQLIDEDMKRYIPKKLNTDVTNIKTLNYLLASNKIFRTVFYFRIQQDEALSRTLSRIISLIVLPALDNIEIAIRGEGFIEGGLKIMHSSGCIIVPRTVGKNLTVFQGVTIGDGIRTGEKEKNNPDIGDNVTIMANAVVAGKITIGDNVTIGAGSIVLKSVPDNCMVVGNPARIIRKDGESVDIKL